MATNISLEQTQAIEIEKLRNRLNRIVAMGEKYLVLLGHDVGQGEIAHLIEIAQDDDCERYDKEMEIKRDTLIGDSRFENGKLRKL